MKRIFSSRVFALAAGLGLRLLFVLEFPATSGDTVLYEQIARNWLKHRVYAMDVYGRITPVDMRTPGYPAFLAVIYALTGRVGEPARLGVMLAQIVVDLLGCLAIAHLARIVTCAAENDARSERAYTMALWLAVLCPFTANYTAVPLTEVFACLWTALACSVLAVALRRVEKPDFLVRGSQLARSRGLEYAALGAGYSVVVTSATCASPTVVRTAASYSASLWTGFWNVKSVASSRLTPSSSGTGFTRPARNASHGRSGSA